MHTKTHISSLKKHRAQASTTGWWIEHRIDRTNEQQIAQQDKTASTSTSTDYSIIIIRSTATLHTLSHNPHETNKFYLINYNCNRENMDDANGRQLKCNSNWETLLKYVDIKQEVCFFLHLTDENFEKKICVFCWRKKEWKMSYRTMVIL